MRARAVFTLLLAAATASGCMRAAGRPGVTDARSRDPYALAPDSITTALWRFDETGGTRVADAGIFRLDGRAGLDTRTDFGRIRGARLFLRSIDSFVYVPYNPVFETSGGLTVEAWIFLNAYGQYEDTPIAARWTQQANEQSWIFSVVGLDIRPPYAALPGPDYHRALIHEATRGELLFAYQPEDASPPRAFYSTRRILPDQWTHVAVTLDGNVVRFWIDGEMDSQYATHGGIRSTLAPLIVGNSFDPRWLTDFGGDLRAGNAPDANPYYAFDGFIDELRISSAARADFDHARGR